MRSPSRPRLPNAPAARSNECSITVASRGISRSLESMETQHSDALVVGAGIAGLIAALKLQPARVSVLSKTRLGKGSATDWAQGGIAAAVGKDDSPRLHAIDTQRAGAGTYRRAARAWSRVRSHGRRRARAGARGGTPAAAHR